MTLDSGPQRELAVAPPPERWDDWVELDPAAWPERREKRIAKLEGNPVHPGSRGRRWGWGTLEFAPDDAGCARPTP